MSATKPLPRKIKVKWPQLDITVTAVMNDEANAHLIDILYERLPYRSLQNHALVSGDHLYHLVPAEKLIYTKGNYIVPNRVMEPDGTVFLSGLQHLAIKYGPLTEYLPAAPCGKIVAEDMAQLVRAGTAIWNACNSSKQVIEVVVWDATKPEPTEQLFLPLERMGTTKEVMRLVEAIHAETEKSWSAVSYDLQLVHTGCALSGAGSKNSYFATMVFINGEIRPLGYNILNNILKIAETDPEFKLRHLVQLFRVFASIPSEFVGYAGATFLYQTFRQIDRVIDGVILSHENEQQGRADFLALVSAFAKYVNLLNAQNLHVFPWRHGAEYLLLRN
ncbi:cucumopine synthase [Aspergillus homomorphus CBS 101889]|uniref:Cucumopine synthase n=1 Tax=Aspergillus homomorphus (strain CBS 101889) TaxID=1450537 RepID=A0A395I1N2_ASPHC|nr:cucumopine synthase [Aspergillus homomorphus CBS 101889]RAL13543.1 cucumopine synthase [Aspergillus homomorphus CBS 101889]